MKKRRLSPQPTDSRLARFVARQVRRWPFAWASTVRDQERRIGLLSAEIHMLLEKIHHLRKDYHAIMTRISPPVIPKAIDVRVYDHMLTCEARICVSFEPVYLALPYEKIARRYDMSEHGRHMTAEAARALSHEHSKQVEKVILANLARVLKQKEPAL